MGSSTRAERVQLIATREEWELKDMPYVLKIQTGIFKKALQGEADIPDKSMINILDIFPQYSIQWLLTGEGDMLITDKQMSTEREPDSERDTQPVQLGIRLTERGENAETSDGWILQQVMPTERHYILLQEPEGLDYMMADAILLFSRIKDGSMQIRPIGVNYNEASEFQDYWLEEVDDKILSDDLDMKTLESMIRFKVDACNHTREEAILSIKSDFERTKVRIYPDVRHLFASYD